MRAIQNFESVQPSTGEFAKPSPGGYILEIVSVEDVPFNPQTGKGDYLKICYDIADGDFRGFYREQAERFNGAWYANFIRSYKEKALGMFKHFINCVTESNPGFRWAWNEQALVRRRFGAILQEEEYEKKDGTVGVRLIVKEVKTVQQILSGEFKIPDRKCLSSTNGATSAPAATSGFGAYATPGGSNDFPMLDADDVSLPF